MVGINSQNQSIGQRRSANARTKQPAKNNRPLVWAIVGGVVGAVLVAGIILGVLAANGMFDNNHDDSGWRHRPSIDKPLIYLYPETETEITVKLGAPEKLTSTYPKYIDGWNVVASPNGDLVDKNTGDKLYALYWEGQRDISNMSFDTGFIIKGEDSAAFLREKLEIMGLNYKEREEFIVYWLPKLEANKYNYIYFATAEEIVREMPLELSVQPDTLIRVSMIFEGLDESIDMKEQNLTPAPERRGFTVVEWGGTEL